MLHSFEEEAKIDKAFEDQKKLGLAIEAYLVLAQSYHLLANAMHKDRHTSESWLSCDEVTCMDTANTFSLIWKDKK